MPIEFRRERVNFESATGGPRTRTLRFEFPSDVRSADAVLNGFNIGFDNSDHPLRAIGVNTSTRVDEEDVEVDVRIGLRDNTGNFDDRYQGFGDVVLIVDREEE